jgi:hypothetical protein
MQIERLWAQTRFMLLIVLFIVLSVSSVFASTSSSTNYQVTETQFNSGASLESCSGQYCAQASIGDLAVGGGSSASYKAEFGSITSEEPVLEVIVEPGVSDLGVLSTDKTATKTTIVKIRNYLSGGYVLQMIGDPPSYNNHMLHAPFTPTASSAGTEQFAINAAANTNPEFGANPKQVPSDQMSFGFAEALYSTPNLFRYVSGDVVARSNTESGQTEYTISMIVNISSATPAGHYASDFSAVVIPVY